MRRVYSSPDQAAITIVCGLLADEGIETIVQNENMSAVAGKVPFMLAMPEVWIVQDEDEERAMAVVERFESGETRDRKPRKPWKCSRCGEMLEGQFTACWRCGTPMETE